MSANGDLDPSKFAGQANTYNAPSSGWENRAVRQATVVMTMPRDQVSALVTPPLPQIGPDPKRVQHVPALTVEQVIVDSSRVYPDQRANYSGGPAGYSGSTRNAWSSNFG